MRHSLFVNDRARFVEITALPDFVSSIDLAAGHHEFGIFWHRARIDQKPLPIELAVRIGEQTVMAQTIVGGQTESKMCRIALATLVVAGFGLVGASGAFAAPANGAAIAELGHQTDQVIQVRDLCGIGRHRRFGHCVPGCGQGWYQPYPGARCRPR